LLKTQLRIIRMPNGLNLNGLIGANNQFLGKGIIKPQFAKGANKVNPMKPLPKAS